MDQQVVHAIKMNDREELRIVLGQYNGKRYIDQRIYFKPKDAAEYRPSKDALRLPQSFCSELKLGMEKAEEVLSEAN